MSKISLTYPDTWLIISISVKNRDTWTEVFSWTMTEIGTTKVYIYDFTEVANTDYVYVATVTGYSNMSGVIYRDGGGLTTTESTHLLQLVNSTGGGGFSSQAIQTSIWNAKREIIEKIESIPKTDLTEIEEKLNEIDSNISLANSETIDTIKQTETEICSDIVRSKKELKEDNVATRQLIRQKAKKQEEFIQKQLDSEAKTQKMIDNESEEIEKALWLVDDENITKAIKQADSEHEQNIIEALNSL